MSKHAFIAVSDFSTKEKKKSFETLHFRFNFLHPAKTKPKFPTPGAQKVIECPRFARGRGMLKFRFDQRIRYCRGIIIFHITSVAISSSTLTVLQIQPHNTVLS